MVANLLENAVRHGAGTVTVAVDGRPDHGTAGEVVMTVSDEGDGIPEENYPMVFTRFWHGSTRSGTGLGLYVVRGLVEAHGGTITVGRGPAGGAEFRFTLPAGAPDYAA
ncbi:sensor histidine kinase [Arsenicicoccus piscis]|uniref:sensor histidine kinase n=1 Tax=Arsenicicoccus piscis TaxID=673954 RepID=UPI001F4CF872|nr:sensor histidine kinase [Arsenicicoccus piscis]